MVARIQRRVERITSLDMGFRLMDLGEVQIDDILEFITGNLASFPLSPADPLYFNILRSIENDGLILRGMAIYEQFVFLLQIFHEISNWQHVTWESINFANQLKKFYWGTIYNMRRSDTPEGRFISDIIDFYFPLYAIQLSTWTENDFGRLVHEEILRLGVDYEYFHDLILNELRRCYPLLGEYELDLFDP